MHTQNDLRIILTHGGKGQWRHTEVLRTPQNIGPDVNIIMDSLGSSIYPPNLLPLPAAYVGFSVQTVAGRKDILV